MSEFANINIGAASWGFRELDLNCQLSIAKSLQMYTLELGIANAPHDIPSDANQDSLDQVKAMFEKYDMPIMFAATGNDFTCDGEKEIDRNLDKVFRVVNVCEALGVSVLRIFAGFAPCDEITKSIPRFDKVISSLNKVAEYAKSKNVILAVETHGGVKAFSDGIIHFNSITTEPKCLQKLVNETVPYLKFVIDPANLNILSLDVNKIIEILNDRIAYAHLKDFKRLSSGHYKPSEMGESNLDWFEIIENISKYTKDFLIEYEVPENVKEGTKACVDYLKQL